MARVAGDLNPFCKPEICVISYLKINGLFLISKLKGMMMNNRQIKRNQHYVPQSYLRRFAIKGEQSLLWSFDKESKRYLKHPSSVKKICCEDYYYYQLDEAGEVNHVDLEDSISEVEKIGNDIINKVINMSAMPYVYLSIEDKSYLGKVRTSP